MAAYFSLMMSHQTLNWLINSWQDLCNTFVQYYQASCSGPKTIWDLGSVAQQPRESLRDYIKRYFSNRNTIMRLMTEKLSIIHHIHQGLHTIKLWRKMFESSPKTISDMLAIVNKHANREDAEGAHHRHKDRRDPAAHPRHKDNNQGCCNDDHTPRHGKNRDRGESSKG